MKIGFKHSGNFNNLERFLSGASKPDSAAFLDRCGQLGVQALASATPEDTGVTASSWDYEITGGSSYSSIVWTNSVVAGSVPLVILLEYGHGTGTGGYVEGRDFISPAITPVFDQIAEEFWREMTGL